HPDLVRISARVEHTLEQAREWLASHAGAAEAEQGARRFAMTLGRATALALLARQAQWSLDHEGDERPLAAARRFSAAGINRLCDMSAADSRTLARDE
ncbi:MAG TPA: hypothetical protein VD867_18255, partial [Burkholderiales bacterium]|nr:hypothetical protein [Burkholderiales bacterium]